MTNLPSSNDKQFLILIVDNNPNNIQILGTILKKQNYSIAFALNGQQTNVFLEHATPDLMIIDTNINDIDCFELVKNIKLKTEEIDFPVIVLSAKNDLEDKINAFSAGCVDYISKPYDSLEVIIRIKTHLKLKQSQDIIKSYNSELERLLELRTKNLIKSERQAAVGDLLQGIVHNLKSPLSGIFFSVEFLHNHLTNFLSIIESNQTIEKEDILKCLNSSFKQAEKIDKVANRLRDMINGLMTKSQNDKIEELRECDLSDLLKQEIDFLDADLRFKHEIEKEYYYSSIPLKVLINPSEVSQVIHNIIRNAIDAMYKTEEPQLIFSTYSIDNYAYIKIIDNGPGIPETIIKKIFDPFFTTKNTDPTNTDEPLGTGLGLHFCRQTIQSYKGDIEVESSQLGGTAFVFKLPLA